MDEYQTVSLYTYIWIYLEAPYLSHSCRTGSSKVVTGIPRLVLCVGDPHPDVHRSTAMVSINLLAYYL